MPLWKATQSGNTNPPHLTLVFHHAFYGRYYPKILVFPIRLKDWKCYRSTGQAYSFFHISPCAAFGVVLRQSSRQGVSKHLQQCGDAQAFTDPCARECHRSGNCWSYDRRPHVQGIYIVPQHGFRPLPTVFKNSNFANCVFRILARILRSRMS